MTFSSVHLSPAWSLPLAIGLSGVLVWYWLRLGCGEVPPSRRKIRRFSIAIMLLSLPMFVRALSYLDPEVDKRPYVVTWTLAIFMLLLVIATALMDAVNNLRLHQAQRQDALHEAAIDLAKAVREHRAHMTTSREVLVDDPARAAHNGQSAARGAGTDREHRG
jgi:hypothetical protein